MSTSLLYHVFGLKRVKFNKTKYEKGLPIIHAEVISAIETCPICGSWKTI